MVGFCDFGDDRRGKTHGFGMELIDGWEFGKQR
jgi:hypothetical protein